MRTRIYSTALGSNSCVTRITIRESHGPRQWLAGLAIPQIDSFDPHRELRTRDLAARGISLDIELECPVLESLVVQPEAIAVPLQQLHAIATAVEEDEQAAVEGIVAKRIADHRQHTVVRLAEVDRVARDEDPDARWQAQHDRNAETRLLS